MDTSRASLFDLVLEAFNGHLAKLPARSLCKGTAAVRSARATTWRVTRSPGDRTRHLG
jgi:hypothetical protein